MVELRSCRQDFDHDNVFVDIAERNPGSRTRNDHEAVVRVRLERSIAQGQYCGRSRN